MAKDVLESVAKYLATDGLNNNILEFIKNQDDLQ